MIDCNQYLVKPNQSITLSDWNTSFDSSFEGSKDEGKDLFKRLNKELEELQELLYAQEKHRVLVVLQGMDTSGKDGTIRHVFDGVNPQGVTVTSFKKPTHHELARDYLWRVHRRVPRRGFMTIFNRSHYEDVLITQVEGWISPTKAKERCEHINQFEKMLSQEGTKIIKLFLHIDSDEQRARLQSRLDRPHKHWKFNHDDLETRKKWHDYQRVYAEVIGQTSTEYAPWYVVPANKKWFRNLVVSSLLVKLLKSLEMEYPKTDFDPTSISIPNI